MKTFNFLFQKSFALIGLLLYTSCEKKEVESLKKDSLPYESVEVLRTSGEIETTGDKDLNIPNRFKFLTLYDESRKNAAVVKISTENKLLLSSLNYETVELVTLDRFIQGVNIQEVAKSGMLEDRSQLQTVTIEFLETSVQKNIRFIGIRFIKQNLISYSGPVQFIFKNSGVNAVHVLGSYGMQQASNFRVVASSCAECGIEILTPQFFALNKLIRYSTDRPSYISLTANAKFSDDLQILW